MDVFRILLRATTDCRSNGLSSSLSEHNPPPQHTGKLKKHRHHDRHDPLASTGSNLRGKCDRRTSRDRSRWFRCGDVIFIDESNLSFILLTIILLALDRRAWKQKVSFYAILSCFCCSDGSIRRALTQAIRRYHFFRDPPSTHLVLAWFRTGGGMRHGRLIRGQERTIELSRL